MTANLVELLDENGRILVEYLNPELVQQQQYVYQTTTQMQSGTKLCIYYGTPAGVNNTWNPSLAAQYFSQFDFIVFGDGVENPADPNYSQNQQTLSLLKQLKPNLVIFGYIDLGVTTQNLSFPAITTKMDQWIAMGANAIFFDDCGYDYHTPRGRLIEALNLAHLNQLPVCVNAWNIDDIFASTVDPVYNPTALPSPVTSEDYFLLESFIYDPTNYTSAQSYATNTGYATLSDITNRINKINTYKPQLGFKTFASSVFNPAQLSTFAQYSLYKTIELACAALGVDGYSLDTVQYSATGENTNVSVFFNTNAVYLHYKNTSNQYTLDNTGYTLLYKNYSVHIDPTTIYCTDPNAICKAFPVEINTGTTAASSHVYTLQSPLFSQNSSALFTARIDSLNTVPIVINPKLQNGSAVLTMTALSGTFSGNVNIDVMC